MQEKKELSLTIKETEIHPNQEIHGRIEVNYNEQIRYHSNQFPN